MGIRLPRRFFGIVVLAALAGCGGAPSSPSSPSSTGSPQTTTVQPPAAPGPCNISFDELRANGPFTSLSACGLTVAASGAPWQALMTYGRPAPFVQFLSNAGVTSVGDVTISGGTFTFAAVDIYSSTTKIPYDITGLAGGATVFQIQDVQGNTFGNFATILNLQAAKTIDTLRIRLTNPAAPCCANPVGLDNIRLAR